MKFSFWYYVYKSAGVLFLTTALGFIFGDRYPWLGTLKELSSVVLLVLGSVGAVMGIRLSLGKLTMLCPFCGANGPVSGDKRSGPCMECKNCGFIHGTGLFGLKLIKEKIKEPSAPVNTH
jgi:hypothetical protein